MSDRDLLNTPDYPIFPPEEHAEVIETVQVVAEDPTGGSFALGEDGPESEG